MSRIRQDFVCYDENIDIFIPYSVAPNSEISLEDESCRLTNNGSHYVGTFSYSTCKFRISNNIVTNTLRVHNILESNKDAVFVEDFKINLKCQLSRESLFMSFKPQVPIVKDEVSMQKTSFYIHSYSDEQFTHELGNGGDVPTNQEIFVEVAMDQPAAHHMNGAAVCLDSCFATPSSNPNHGVKFPLIRDRCNPAPAVNLLTSPSPHRFRFKVQAFEFKNKPGSAVGIHCKVGVCPIDHHYCNTGDDTTSSSPDSSDRGKTTEIVSHVIRRRAADLVMKSTAQTAASTLSLIAVVTLALALTIN